MSNTIAESWGDPTDEPTDPRMPVEKPEAALVYRDGIESKLPGVVLIVSGAMLVGLNNFFRNKGWLNEISKTSREDESGHLEITLPNALFRIKSGGTMLDVFFPGKPSESNGFQLETSQITEVRAPAEQIHWRRPKRH